MKLLIYICIYFTFITIGDISAQSLTCTDGEVLCSLGELDDFEGTMPSSNPNDEPAPFCGGTGNPQNMSWFAFIAGSATAELELVTSNCNNGTTIQYGIYTDCTYSESIICQGSAVNANGTITLNLTGMVPGDNYYFFIDGDLGTYCDYAINVVSGGDPVPVPQPTDIICASSNCPTDNMVCNSSDIYTFEVEGLDLSIDYLWSITPLPAGYPPNPQTTIVNSIDLSFPGEGDYSICMEATNGCTTTDEICIDFIVFEADAGELEATPNPLCPGETSTVTVTDYIISDATSELLIIVGSDGVIIDIVDPATTDVTMDECGTITVYSYNFLTDDNPGVPAVGENYTSINCSNHCCDVESIDIVFEDNEDPNFVDPPQDITLDCADITTDIEDLNWTDNCDGSGSVMGLEVTDYTTCNGGTVTRTWTYTDVCNNTAEHVQVITLTPAPTPEYIDPPEDVTLDCDGDPGVIPDLSLSNGQSGVCLIEGSIEGTETSAFNTCDGGTTTRTWEFTDVCGSVVTYVQTITINPPPEVTFIDPPSDVTINCDEIPSSYPTLALSNDQSGNCLMTGTIDPTLFGDPGTCGGDIDVVWIFTDECNRVTSHVQIITVLPAALPSFINPPDDVTLSCVDDIPSSDDLDYDNGETGDCHLMGTITPVITNDVDGCGGTIVNSWEFTDDCNQTLSHIQTIIIEPPLEASYIDPPADVTITCDEVPPSPTNLSYGNGELDACEIMGSSVPSVVDDTDVCGGTIVNTWEFTDDCSRTITETQTITVEPTPEAAFVDTPEDMTIACDEIIPVAPDLLYTNGGSGDCEISGSIIASVDDNSNSCGGTIVYTWEFTDPCSRTITATQTITITEAPESSFISPPVDEIVSCETIVNSAQALSYTNNDDCAIMGSVDPQIEDNTDICGGTIVNTWEFTDDCGRSIQHVQTITKEPALQAIFINTPANVTVSCGDNATAPSDLNYSNGVSGDCDISGSVSPVQSGSYDACGGEVIFTWEFTDDCQRIIQHVQTVLVDPAPISSFIDPPDDITVSCESFSVTPPTLNYSNGSADICEISGQVDGVVVGSPSPCGVIVMYRWEFVDDCGRSIVHTQDVTIEEAPTASFIAPPMDINLACLDVEILVPSLDYTNSANGICQIDGSVNGIQSGAYDQCGGDISYSWTFTDECNRVITHNQSITVSPASDPVFVDVPEDITLDCGEAFPIDPSLTYSNGETGVCLIEGSVIATSIVTGNITTYTWEFTNNCNNVTISHEQNVTGVDIPDISISPADFSICYGSDFDLSTIMVLDANGSTITITYLDASGNLIVNPIVSPVVNTTYTIVATNDAGCTDQEIFTLTIDSPPIAGLDGTGKICDTDDTYNLFDYLNGAYEPNGTWFDTDNSGVNIDNPTVVDFSGVVPGFYQFTYTVFSTNTCPDVSAIITIEFIDELDIEILVVECEANGSSYHVNVFSGGNIIVCTAGDVTIIDANNVLISNIPSGQSVVVSGFDSDGYCNTNINVNAPDCDCPNVPAPESGGDVELCEGDLLTPLTANVGSGYSVNWYGSPTGNDILATNTTTYTPLDTAPGIYSYYIEAEDVDGCVSLIRTPIKLTINEGPILNEIDVVICADEDGGIKQNLPELNTLINSNVNFVFTYFNTFMEAENNTNVLYDNLASSSSITIYVRVTNTSGCFSIAPVNLINSPLPNYTLTVNNENCEDGNDGSIIIANTSPDNTTYSLDGVTYESTSSFDNLTVGTHTLYAKTENDCETMEMFTIVEGLILTYSDLSIICNDNGTNTDSSDDYYTISFTINNNQNLTDQLNVSTATDDYGSFDFGNISIDIPVGNEQIITIIHPITGCFLKIETGELNPCSSSCSISIVELSQECNGNNTPTNPSDDTYDIFVNASAINGASNNSFNIVLDGNILANFEYGIGGSIVIPAQSQTITLSIVDNEDNQCFANEIVGPLVPCSNTCVISLDNQNFVCENQGTIGDPSDDIYLFSFTVIATNTTSTMYNLLLDGVQLGSYSYGDDETYDIMADGLTHTISFVDQVDPTCMETITSPILNSCSGSCSINTVLLEVNCNNENTASNNSDDSYTVIVKIDMVGGSGSWSINTPAHMGTSGETIELGPFLISNGNVSIEIVDSNVSGCSTIIDITAPSPCSSCEETVDAGVDHELDCDITEATLSGNSSTIGEGVWTGPGGFESDEQEISVMIQGIYIYTVDFGEGCIVSDTTIVNVSNGIPIAFAGVDNMITCLQDSVVLIGSVMGGSGNYSYEWLDENMDLISTSLSIKVGDAGHYFFSVYDIDNDCTAPVDAMEVADQSGNLVPVIYANPGDELDCIVEFIFLTNDEEANTQYYWYVNNQFVNDETITIDEAANIKLVAIDTLTGCDGETTLNITSLEQYPFISIIDPQEISCEILKVVLDGSQSQSGENISYTWIDEDNNIIATNVNILDITEAGTYYLELIDSDNNCTNRDTIVVNGSSDGVVIDLAASITSAPGEVIELSADVNILPEDIASVQWSPAANLSCSTCLTTELIVGSSDQVYSVIIKDIYGCTAVASITIISFEEISVTIPNVFSPDSENTENQYFTIYTNDEHTIIRELSIYDRWGGRLFTNKNFKTNIASLGWDGKFKGEFVQPGVYVFSTELLLGNGLNKRISGDLTIVK